jgi:hypothetical protein
MWPTLHVQLLNAPPGPLSPAARANYLDQYVVIARVTRAEPVSDAVIEGLVSLATQCDRLSSLECYAQEVRTLARSLADELTRMVAEAAEACGRPAPMGPFGPLTAAEARVLDLDGRRVLGRLLAEMGAAGEASSHPVVERARRLVCHLELLKVWVQAGAGDTARPLGRAQLDSRHPLR